MLFLLDTGGGYQLDSKSYTKIRAFDNKVLRNYMGFYLLKLWSEQGLSNHQAARKLKWKAGDSNDVSDESGHVHVNN